MGESDARPDNPGHLYAYCDEATFKAAAGQTHAVGALLTDAPVTQELVDSALDRLRSVGSSDSRDIATLERGYFHASEDSKNAHSVLCTEINNRIEGEFFYDGTRNEPSVLVRHARVPDEEAHLSVMFQGALIHLTQHARALTLTIEGRAGFNERTATRVVEALYDGMEAQLWKQPNIPCMFPMYSLAVRGKDDPGLQVVDFLLWATNRTNQDPPRTDWYDRIEKLLSDRVSFEGSPEMSGGFILKRMVRKQLVKYPDEALPVQDVANQDEILEAVCLIERTAREVAKLDLPSHVGHYKDEVRSTFVQLDQDAASLSVDSFRRLASHYVRLFDTLPIFSSEDASDPDGWRRALLARRLASALLARNPWTLRQIDTFILFRREHFQSNPDWFGR